MTNQEIWDKYQDRTLGILRKLSEELRAYGLRVGEPWLVYEEWDDPSWGWVVEADSLDIPPDLLVRVEVQLNPRPGNRTEFGIVANAFRRESNAIMQIKILAGKYAGYSVDKNDASAIEAHIRQLESEEILKPIREAVIRFVKDLRRKFRKSPREWSPRWDKPSMGGARGFSPIRINIVEQEGWKWKDSEVSGWASDNALDDLVHMSDATRKELVRDLIEASMTKKEQKAITDEDLEKISEQLEEDWQSLEETKNAIQDAHYWAWEVAYMPEDGDIEYSMEKDKDFWGEDIRPNDYWKLVLREEGASGPREWSPHPTETDFWKDLANRVRFERKPDYYDRHLVFDWGQSKTVRELLEALKEHPEEGSRKEVEQELRDWADTFTSEVLSHLDDRMQNVDTSYRVDFNPQWKRILSDKSRMANVRDELLEFLQMGPRDWSPRRGKK